MKQSVFLLILFLASYSCPAEEKSELKDALSFTPPISEEVSIQRANSILGLMSLDEKLLMIKGHERFYLKGFEKYGIPQFYLSDATQGVHIRENLGLGEQLEKSTAFPSPILLAATWNPDQAEVYARSIGEECRAGGIGVLLGPGMNIYRISQNGRNFEYQGEDPFLASRMIERYVIGMQSTGTIATLKHFVANNNEYRRKACNVIVDDRALHEIYMPAFKAGVDAGAMAVMTAYNLVNGEWSGQNQSLINETLRGELGFNWLVMTDWRSVIDSKKVITSGQDLEMPGGESMHNVEELLEAGEITEAHIDRMVRSILKTFIAMGMLDRPVKDESYLDTFPQHVEVALNTAREGIVLLKNDDDILPISPDAGKKILLIGEYIETLATGGGSANVKGYDHVTMKDALMATFKNLKHLTEPNDEDLQSADVVIVSVGTDDSESRDRPFALPAEQENLVLRVLGLNKNVVVVVNSGGGIRMTDWNDSAAAIIYNWFGGQIGNQALAEIISGKISPSGHLPITIEKEFIDSPGAGYLPEGASLNSGQNIREMEVAVKSVYDLEYKESIFVGYRWYESKNIEPLYHFGHGLSYSSFELGNLQLSKQELSANDVVEVTFDVKNTGRVSAATVAQLYVQDVEASVSRPVKELKGFQKIWLEPGEAQKVSIKLNGSAFAFWDVNKNNWKVEAGDFNIMLGESSGDISETKHLKIK
jgi:beta-glucosidase